VVQILQKASEMLAVQHGELASSKGQPLNYLEMSHKDIETIKQQVGSSITPLLICYFIKIGSTNGIKVGT
jgi:hypothetical protein